MYFISPRYYNSYLSILLLFYFLVFSINIFAQNTPHQRCPDTMPNKQYVKGLNNAIQTWMVNDANDDDRKRGARGEVKFTVPIVIHIIHNGEPIGTGTNISDEQVIKQIESTNKDFLGDNNWESIMTNFKNVVGFAGINFELAKQDPLGRPTIGINRINGNKNKWSSEDENLFMSLSYWPPKDYINVWVLNLVENDDVFAFSTFPIYQLDGLSTSSIGTPHKFEGIFIDYMYFGTNQNGGNYTLTKDIDLGRTLTHELGHYFGLLHTWGDGSCDTDDYVTDTPLMAKPTNGGCSSENEKTSCDSLDMIQNFMDYTDDICLLAFTLGQVSRMQTVIKNGHNRKSLLTSKGLENPTTATHRLSITSATLTSTCSSEYQYNYQIVNVGTSNVNSFTLSKTKNDVLVESKDYNIKINANQTINGEALPMTLEAGKNIITLSITAINGSPVNAMLGSSFTTENYHSPLGTLPFSVQNANNLSDWSKVGNWKSAQLSYTSSNNPVLFADMPSTPYSNYELHSKSFDFITNDTVAVSFKWAYYSNSATLTDNLSVWVSSCDNILLNKRIFVQYEQEMITMNTSTPSKDDDWIVLKENIPNIFKGHRVKIIVVGQNYNAGKLYIENLKVQNNLSDVTINNIDFENENSNLRIIPKLYPNPVLGSYLFLELNNDDFNNKIIEIIDNQGLVIKTFNKEKELNSINLYVGDIKKGIYTLRIIEGNKPNDNKYNTIRFIKL